MIDAWELRGFGLRIKGNELLESADNIHKRTANDDSRGPRLYRYLHDDRHDSRR